MCVDQDDICCKSTTTDVLTLAQGAMPVVGQPFIISISSIVNTAAVQHDSPIVLGMEIVLPKFPSHCIGCVHSVCLDSVLLRIQSAIRAFYRDHIRPCQLRLVTKL